MKKSDYVILAFVIAFIIGVAIFVYLRSKPENPSERKIDALKRRLKQIEDQIKNEVASLKLTTKIQQYLDAKIARYFMLFKIIFLLIVGWIFYLLKANGYDYVNAALSTAGILGLFF